MWRQEKSSIQRKTPLPLSYTVTGHCSHGEACHALNCAFLPPPHVKTWKQNSHGLVSPRSKRDNVDMEGATPHLDGGPPSATATWGAMDPALLRSCYESTL